MSDTALRKPVREEKLAPTPAKPDNAKANANISLEDGLNSRLLAIRRGNQLSFLGGGILLLFGITCQRMANSIDPKPPTKPAPDQTTHLTLK